ITRAVGPGRQGRARALAAAAAALPLLVYDAFALFTGHRAAAIPGRQAISLVLASAGVVLVYRGAGWLGARVADAAGAGAGPGVDAGARRRARATALSLVAAALALHLVNREVLPRLYGWFHATLALLTFVLALVAARIYAGLRSAGPPRAAAALGGAGVLADGARP